MAWLLWSVVLTLATAPWWWPHGAATIDLAQLLLPPNATHWLGTDELGRDVLVRLGAALQLGLFVGVVTAVGTALIGVPLGLLAGYWRGPVDVVLQRVMDIVLAFPGLLLAIALAAVLGPGLNNVLFALIVLGWVGFARLARAQVLSLREQDFVTAARLQGVGVLTLLWRHLWPNAAPALRVEFAFAVTGAMLAEAALSFLGMGVQPPTPSLGNLLREGGRYMLVAPHLVIIPALALMAVVLAVMGRVEKTGAASPCGR